MAVRNLALIFNATLELANEKGFQAMSMRDLSEKTGLSLGALYAYFPGKTELLDSMLQQGWKTITGVLIGQLAVESGPRERLHSAVRTHLYLSELLQPWFYFSYMEAKNLRREEMKKIIRSELFTEKIFFEILESGMKGRVFDIKETDMILTSSVIKAILQDWYVKRWKYAQRGVAVDDYLCFVIALIEKMILPA